MLYLQKYLGIFKNVFLAERWGRLLLRLKMSSAQSFCFCNSHMTTFPTSRKWKISIFPLHCLSRNAISSKVFNEFSKLFLAKRWGRWLLRLKMSSAQSFCFCNSNMTTFPTSRKWKISIFPLHCLSRNAISSKVFNEFSKTFFGWKVRKVAIVVQNFRCTDIMVLQYQRYNFSNIQKMKYFNFSFTLS